MHVFISYRILKGTFSLPLNWGVGPKAEEKEKLIIFILK